MCMNGPNLQAGRGDVFGNCVSWRSSSITFFTEIIDIQPREVLHASHDVFAPAQGCRHPLRSMKEPPTLRGERVFVDVGTVFQRAFVLEHASHCIHRPYSSTSNCFPVFRVMYLSLLHVMLVPSTIIPYLSCFCSVVLSPRTSQTPRGRMCR